MDIAGLLANVATNFRSKYLSRAQEFDYLKPQIQNQPAVVERPAETAAPEVPVDEYIPSSDSKPAPIAGDPTGIESDQNKTESPSKENPVEQKPDGSYFYNRNARLDYRLDLQFNLAAVTQTVERLSEGDTESIESLAAAGFGLQAGFDIKGIQRIKTNMAEAEAPTRRHQLTEAKSRRAGMFRAQSDDFAVQSYYKEASKVHRSLNETVNGAHRKAVNKFAARFRLDSGFSFAHLQRFNVQTERVATEMPDAVAGYVTSAGEVAAKGSNEMMASFFDAVDGYLDGAEQAMLDKVTAFFDAAAEELGFTGAMVEQTRAHLTETIEGFFDRVDAALDQVETRFVPQREVPIPEIIDEPSEPVVIPEPVESEKATLAED